MAERRTRLPSEQTPEGELADAITDLTKLLARKAGPWWDTINCLDVDVRALLSNSYGQGFWLHVPCSNPSYQLILIVTPYIDKIELRLVLNPSIILWQKVLFYELPQIGIEV